MRGLILGGAMFRILSAGMFSRRIIFLGNRGSLYANWESPEGRHAAIKITGSWNKFCVEAYKSAQLVGLA